MSPRTSPPFRADHVGSFLRPARLHDARQQRADGAISAEQLRAVEDEAVRQVVALQREAGLRSVTDGEFRRATWHMDFVYQIGGISKVPGRLLSTFHNEQGDIAFTPDAIHVTRRLSMDKTIFGDGLRVPAVGRRGLRAQADDSRALDGPLPVRHPGGRGRVGVPGRGGVLGRSGGGVPRRGPAARRPGLPVPAARRHVAGVRERPRRSASTSPSAARTPSTSTSGTSR